MDKYFNIYKGFEKYINSFLKGKEKAVKIAMLSILAGGHIIIEDIPGLGKTTLALTLAHSLDLSFGRIQGTNDLLPPDIIGYEVFDKNSNNLVFKKGPIFNNIILFDEINRASPKTQSALLEAMEENGVTYEGHTYSLPKPFMVIATQNPYDEFGTYPLPESEWDRFQMRLLIGYPPYSVERQILKEGSLKNKVNHLKAVIKKDELLALQEFIRTKIYISDNIYDYLLNIANHIRESDDVLIGLSTRACLDIVSIAKVSAFIAKRDYVIPEDIVGLSNYTMPHRIIFKNAYKISDKEALLRNIIKEVKNPL